MAFAPGTEQNLQVRVQGEGVEGFTGQMDNAVGSLMSFKGAVGMAGAALGALATGALVSAVDAARSFEQAMVEVEKVTNPETAAAMSDEIRNMARTIPLAQEQLAGLAADAARFGIRGTENLRAFSTSVAKMATATDLSANEAGEALARLSELTDTPAQKIENLGSVVNELSNNFATSSSEITDAMLRSSAALSQLGLNQTQIAAMSASLNEVSASARRAGTRMRRVAQQLMNPRKVSDIAAALGMTVEEFEAMRDESPNELLMQMVEAFKAGGDEADALRATLSTASRQALAGLAQNADGLNEALATSSEQFKENTSLQAEFEAATDTLNAKLQLLKNTIHNEAIEIGNVLLPYLTDAVTATTRMVGAGDGLLSALTSQQKAWGLVGTAVGGAALAIATFVSGPLGIAIAAIAALGAAWANNVGDIQGITEQALAEVAPEFRSASDEAAEALRTGMNRGRQVVRDALAGVRSYWRQNGEKITAIVRTVMRTYKLVLGLALSGLRRLWRKHGAKVIGSVQNTVGFIIETLRFLSTTLLALMAPVLARIETFWRNHGTIIRNLVVGLAGIVIATLRGLMNLVRGILEVGLWAAKGVWQWFGDEIVGIVSFAADAILSTLGWLLQGIDAAIKVVQAAMRGDWKAAWNIAAGFAEDTMSGLWKFLTKWGAKLASWFGDLGSKMGRLFRNALNNAIPDSIGLPSANIAGHSIGGGSIAIPQLAAGGVVTSPTLAMVGEGGESEAVVPLSELKQMLGGAAAAGAAQRGDGQGRPVADKIEVYASGRREGSEAGAAFVDELKSAGFRP